jgi:hypothetical protein
MSLLQSFLRLIDPIEYRRQEQDKRRKREALPPEVDGHELDEPAPSAPRPKVPLLRCRICRYEAATGHRFCPRCLAETMERAR